MKITGYTAMTATEFQNADRLRTNLAWMACHFSCYATGLSNLPRQLPPDAMVIVNDRTPVHRHDPAVIAGQLCDLYENLRPAYFLLDLQRPENPETRNIVKALVKALPCPVGVSSVYAEDLDCPVFLPPPPIDCPLDRHLKPWEGREIWLEITKDAQTATVTENGCSFSPATAQEPDENYLFDSQVHCHYRTEASENALLVHLRRGVDALQKMLEKAGSLGITLAVGLYQQLGTDFFEKDTLRS